MQKPVLYSSESTHHHMLVTILRIINQNLPFQIVEYEKDLSWRQKRDGGAGVSLERVKEAITDLYPSQESRS